MDRKSITVVVVVVLCAAGFAYSQGWFSRSSVSSDTESNTITANQDDWTERRTESGCRRPRSELRSVTAKHGMRPLVMKRIDQGQG